MEFFAFFLLILVLIFIPKKSASKRKGIKGEKLVVKKISKLSQKHIILNDLLIDYKNNTTQIDHVVITKNGVFVIETKNYSGNIYCKDNEKYWTQLLNGYENHFYNPIWQNNAHIRAVKYKLRNVEELPIYSIVVFCGKCKLKDLNGKNEVIYLKRLNRHIKSIKSDRKLNNEEIRNIKEILEESNIKSMIKRKKHIKNIRKNIESNKK